MGIYLHGVLIAARSLSVLYQLTESGSHKRPAESALGKSCLRGSGLEACTAQFFGKCIASASRISAGRRCRNHRQEYWPELQDQYYRTALLWTDEEAKTDKVPHRLAGITSVTYGSEISPLQRPTPTGLFFTCDSTSQLCLPPAACRKAHPIQARQKQDCFSFFMIFVPRLTVLLCSWKSTATMRCKLRLCSKDCHPSDECDVVHWATQICRSTRLCSMATLTGKGIASLIDAC